MEINTRGKYPANEFIKVATGWYWHPDLDQIKGCHLRPAEARKLLERESSNPNRHNFIGTAVETGWWTDGRCILKLKGKELESYRNATDGGGKILFYGFLQKFIDKQGRWDLFPTHCRKFAGSHQVLLQSRSGRGHAVICDGQLHQTILNRWPGALPVLSDGPQEVVKYVLNGEVKAVLSPIAWDGEVNVYDMLGKLDAIRDEQPTLDRYVPNGRQRVENGSLSWMCYDLILNTQNRKKVLTGRFCEAGNNVRFVAEMDGYNTRLYWETPYTGSKSMMKRTLVWLATDSEMKPIKKLMVDLLTHVSGIEGGDETLAESEMELSECVKMLQFTEAAVTA